MILCKGLSPDDTIGSVDEWFAKCPPEKGKEHWVDGRSAKELAKYWCEDPSGLPDEVPELLKSHTDFAGVDIEIASPEYETRFDEYGKGRQHDLLLIGRGPDGHVVIGLEAKVDESFGSCTTEAYYEEYLNKRHSGVSTNVPARIEGLLDAIFQPDSRSDGQRVMYQLLHATAGTLAEARKQKATKALLVIQTFLTPVIDGGKHKANVDHLDFFVSCVSAGRQKRIRNGDVIGPLRVPGNNHIPSDVDLYIGCVEVEVR